MKSYNWNSTHTWANKCAYTNNCDCGISAVNEADWKALEADGWEVMRSIDGTPLGAYSPCNTPGEAITRFEQATGRRVDDCNCHRAHDFYMERIPVWN